MAFNILSILDVGYGLVAGKVPSPSFASIVSGAPAPTVAPGSPTTASGQPVVVSTVAASPTSSTPAPSLPTAAQPPLAGNSPGVDYLQNLITTIQGL